MKGKLVTRVLLSAPWTWAFGEPPPTVDGASFQVVRRASDWGMPPWRARLRMLREALTVARHSAAHDCVVLSTVGIEASLVAALVKLRSRHTRVVVFDFLAPRAQLPPRIARAMVIPVDRFLVIRSGDAAMLRSRFGVPEHKVSFLPWPVRADQLPDPGVEEDYVYSAGWAHRDWACLLSALDRAGLPATLAPGRPLTIPEGAVGRIEVIEMPPPDLGRTLTARARVVAVALVDTDLPSGPLVLLDAMAMGKAVVASAVNGTRDYVRDGETALVVPPGDPVALSAALTRLWRDEALRRRLGAAARTETLERCSLPRFWEGLAASCR